MIKRIVTTVITLFINAWVLYDCLQGDNGYFNKVTLLLYLAIPVYTVLEQLSPENGSMGRKIGFVFQAFNLVPMLNVYENIVLPLELDGEKIDKEYVEEIIDTLMLTSKKEMLPNQLSGGQQQRVAIARALAFRPAIILADEPTGNLDSKTGQDVLSLLKVSADKYGQTIVMITHNDEIAQLADRIIRIEDGHIVSESERR